MPEVSTVSPHVLNRLIQTDMHSFRIGFFVLALLLYGAFGSPTPDNPGVLEAVIAVLLALSIGFSGVFNGLRFKPDAPRWKVAAQIFLIFGLGVPLIGGIVAGNTLTLILRDVVPFLFLCLPLFMMRHNSVGVLYGVLAVGVLFAVRGGSDVPYLGGGDKLFYLANMPSVLFAAVFFAGSAVQNFAVEFNKRAVLKVVTFCGLAALCLYPVIETQQRASIGVFALSMVVIFAFYFCKYPRRVFILAGVVASGLILMLPALRDVFEALGHKTELVGVNMRAAEWAAVWGEVSAHPVSLFIGKGWGATFSSPAVADIEVNFTHGLLSSLLLKTGLVGLGLGMLYLACLGRGFLNMFKLQPVLVMALAGPILIDVLLYASFKSLDFGLMLLLALGLRFYGDGNMRSVETVSSVLYSDTDTK